jgi:hypothetical protein
MSALTSFENTDAGGKGTSIVSWGSSFYSGAYCGGYCTFTTSLYQSVRDAGGIPDVNWGSTSDQGETGYTDAQIANGSQDSYITQWARAAKAWGHPFLLRFDWEMNGSWFDWGAGANGNTAADYVAMWRHVHDIFTSVGATNATWVWCPNVEFSGLTPLTSLYPGDSYVDWTCLDGYNGGSPWTSFQGVFQKSYDDVTGNLAPSKPMLIGETASTESGGSKAQWITDMLNNLPTVFPKVGGFIWYDDSTPGPGGKSDWTIETSSASKSAFANGISSSTYSGNSFADLNTTKVQPPAA